MSEHGDSWDERLMAALQAGDWPTAVALAEAAVADPVSDTAASLALAGQVCVGAGDVVRARGYLERALGLGVEEAEVFARLAVLVEDEAPDRALELMEAAVAAGGDAAWQHCFVGRLRLLQRLDAHGALEAIASGLASAEDPSEAAPLLTLAVQASVAAGDRGGLLGAVEALLGLESAPPAEAWLGAAGAAMAWVEGQLAPPAELIADSGPFGKLVARAASAADHGALYGEGQLQAARLRRCRFDFEGARVCLDRAARWLVGDLRVVRMGVGLDILRGRLPEAQATLSGPDGGRLPAELTLALADAWRRQGELALALSAARQVTEREPDHAGGWIELARLLTADGDEAAALEAFSRAAGLDPEVDIESGRAQETLRRVVGELPQLIAASAGAPMGYILSTRFGHNAIVARVRLEGGQTVYAKAFLPGRRSLAHAESTARLMEAVADRAAAEGLQSPRALSGDPAHLAHRGALGPVLVLSAVDGHSLRREHRHPRRTMEASQARALGGVAARLQRILAGVSAWEREALVGMAGGLKPFMRWSDHGFDPGALLSGAASRRADIAQRLQGVTQRITGLTPAVAAALGTLEPGIIHGDFGWHNVTWSAGKVIGVIDFDYGAWDYPITDLLNAVNRTAFDWGRLLVNGDPSPRPEIGRAIFQGYRDAGGMLPPVDVLDPLFAGVRVNYYLSMAATQLSLSEESGWGGEVRSPRTYNDAADTLDVLISQLDWLAQNGGLRGLVDESFGA